MRGPGGVNYRTWPPDCGRSGRTCSGQSARHRGRTGENGQEFLVPELGGQAQGQSVPRHLRAGAVTEQHQDDIRLPAATPSVKGVRRSTVPFAAGRGTASGAFGSGPARMKS